MNIWIVGKTLKKNNYQSVFRCASDWKVVLNILQEIYRKFELQPSAVLCLKMVTNMVCLHNKFGFCKFGHMCHKRHIDDICQENCFLQDCQKRHPRPCKYFVHFNRCKFGENCKYKHEKENF